MQLQVKKEKQKHLFLKTVNYLLSYVIYWI